MQNTNLDNGPKGAENLFVLSQAGIEWLEVSQDSKAHKQYHQHDGKLEVGVKGDCQNLGGNKS